MATSADARQARLVMQAAHDVPAELLPVEVVEAVAGLQPLLARIRSGEWRCLITGPRSSRERDEAGMLSARLIDLADALDARR